MAQFDAGGGPIGRHRIAQALHDGILQDLTIAGLRLTALGRSPTTSRQDLATLAAWLGDRQAALRDLVSALGDTKAGPDGTVVALVGAIFERGTPQHVEINSSRGRLAVSHNGPAIKSDAAALKALRRSIKGHNGRLSVRSTGGTETLAVTLAESP